MKRQKISTYTAATYHWNQMLWAPIRLALRKHFKDAGKGSMSRMARALGIQPSQLHRYSCGKCEHEQEPRYSVGAAIVLYLQTYRHHIDMIDPYMHMQELIGKHVRVKVSKPRSRPRTHDVDAPSIAIIAKKQR